MGGKVVLSVAIANGFRNIQNLLRQMKQRRCAYHFVEVMACPAGCLNGGAQIPRNPAVGKKEMLERMEKLYHTQRRREGASAEAVGVFERVFGGEGRLSAELWTEYRSVASASTEETLAIKW